MSKKSGAVSVKKPSLKGEANYGYLGHFAQDKFIQQGHNDDGKITYEREEKRIPGPAEQRSLQMLNNYERENGMAITKGFDEPFVWSDPVKYDEAQRRLKGKK
jgi:hypothetical protein